MLNTVRVLTFSHKSLAEGALNGEAGARELKPLPPSHAATQSEFVPRSVMIPHLDSILPLLGSRVPEL